MIELTGQYAFMLPLLVSCFAAYGIAEAMGDKPIYEALRERTLSRDHVTGRAAPG
jgi:CIC family chloride channel protein